MLNSTIVNGSFTLTPETYQSCKDWCLSQIEHNYFSDEWITLGICSFCVFVGLQLVQHADMIGERASIGRPITAQQMADRIERVGIVLLKTAMFAPAVVLLGNLILR